MRCCPRSKVAPLCSQARVSRIFRFSAVRQALTWLKGCGCGHALDDFLCAVSGKTTDIMVGMFELAHRNTPEWFPGLWCIIPLLMALNVLLAQDRGVALQISHGRNAPAGELAITCGYSSRAAMICSVLLMSSCPWHTVGWSQSPGPPTVQYRFALSRGYPNTVVSQRTATQHHHLQRVPASPTSPMQPGPQAAGGTFGFAAASPNLIFSLQFLTAPRSWMTHLPSLCADYGHARPGCDNLGRNEIC